MSNRIPLTECVHGGLYRIFSRNLSFGVFDAKRQGFIGIREKFRTYFLFLEYHFDTGAPFGTVHPHEFLEMCPIDNLREYLESRDDKTNRLVAFDKPVKDGGKGWYFVDTGEASQEIRSFAPINQPLFDWLKEKEKQYYKEEE
jgi:hypothetical protein